MRAAPSPSDRTCATRSASGRGSRRPAAPPRHRPLPTARHRSATHRALRRRRGRSRRAGARHSRVEADAREGTGVSGHGRPWRSTAWRKLPAGASAAIAAGVPATAPAGVAAASAGDAARSAATTAANENGSTGRPCSSWKLTSPPGMNSSVGFIAHGTANVVVGLRTRMVDGTGRSDWSTGPPPVCSAATISRSRRRRACGWIFIRTHRFGAGSAGKPSRPDRPSLLPSGTVRTMPASGACQSPATVNTMLAESAVGSADVHTGDSSGPASPSAASPSELSRCRMSACPATVRVPTGVLLIDPPSRRRPLFGHGLTRCVRHDHRHDLPRSAHGTRRARGRCRGRAAPPIGPGRTTAGACPPPWRSSGAPQRCW